MNAELNNKTWPWVASPLTLGTAQLGIPYGVANRSGQPEAEEARRILDTAWEGGIRSFDTAHAYGVAESLLGDYFKHTTSRTPPLIISKFKLTLDHRTSWNQFEAQIEEAIQSIQDRLQLSCIPALLFHRPDTLARFGKRLTDFLRKQVNCGKVKKFGVSLPSVDSRLFDEIWPVLQEDFYEIVQFPLNILDQRTETLRLFDKLRCSGKRLFVRSIYLQGLFFLEPEELPAHLQAYKLWIARLREFAERERLSMAELAFSYIRHLPGVTSIVFGAETVDQVKNNIALLNVPPIAEETQKLLEREFADVPEYVVSPAQWNTSR